MIPPVKRTYRQTVDYLFGLLPMYQRTGAIVGKLDLSKTEALLSALGDPHRGLTVVHVGGTNGKGSVSHAIASLCTAAGQRVGLYTSPHYVDYRERIRIDGQKVPEAYVVDFVAEHQDLIEATGASFFEFTVAMAFAYFAHAEVDVAVVEVGLGGRLDSTNVVTPALSVITNVDLDHTEILGDTRALIAAEKAGIIKAGRPVVVGRYQEETWPVFSARADALGAPLHQAWRYPAERFDGLEWDKLSLRGPFARENVRTALVAYAVLAEGEGLGQAGLTALSQLEKLSGYGGRFVERVAQQDDGTATPVIADAGHNSAAWAAVVPAVLAKAGRRTVRVVCGFVQGKDPLDFVGLWPAGTAVYVGDLDVPRNVSTAATLAKLAEGNRAARGYDSIAEAYQAALNDAAPDELIFVGGSSYVVGAYLAAVG